MHNLVHGQFTKSCWIKVFQNDCELVFIKFNAELSEAIFEFNWIKETILVVIESSKGDSESSQTISSRFIPAGFDNSGSKVSKINHFDVLSEIWILQVEISAGRLSEAISLCFLFEINVAVESTNSLGLISCLSKTRGSSEWIWSNRCTHIEILSIQSMGPMSNWLLLSVISLWDSLPELFIWTLLESSPGSVLDDKLFVTLIHTDVGAILSDHNSSTDGILSVTFIVVGRSCRSFEISLLFFHFTLFVFLIKFGQYLHSDLMFTLLSLSANLWKVISWIVALANLSVHL